jgi:hypothetical protein
VASAPEGHAIASPLWGFRLLIVEDVASGSLC